MRKYLITTFAAFCLAAFSFAQSFDTDRVEGFRDILWGSKIDSCYDENGNKITFNKVANPAIPNSYERSGEEMNIGAVKCTRINYVFNDESRLNKVLVEGNKEDFEEMKFILEYKFGEALQEYTSDNRTVYEWQVYDVTFQLVDHKHNVFGLIIESDFEMIEAYRKNTTVDDF